MDVYTDLFVDSVQVALIYPFKDPFILEAILAFGDYLPWKVSAVFLLGSMAGFLANYLLGRWLVNEPWFSDKHGYVQVAKFVKSYVWWLPAFAWVSVLGPFSLLLVGFFQVSFYRAMAAAAVGQLAYLVNLYI